MHGDRRERFWMAKKWNISLSRRLLITLRSPCFKSDLYELFVRCRIDAFLWRDALFLSARQQQFRNRTRFNFYFVLPAREEMEKSNPKFPSYIQL